MQPLPQAQCRMVLSHAKCPYAAFYSQSLNSNLWQPHTYGMQPFESETPMLLYVSVAHFILLLSGIPWYQSLSMPLVKDI